MERVGSMELSGRMKRQRKRLSGRGFSRCGEWRVRQPIILQGRLFTDEKRGWKDRSSTPERAMLRSDSSFLPLILSRLHTINLTQEHFIGWIDYWTFTHRRDNIAWSRKSTNWIYRLCQHFVKVLHPRTFFYLFIMGDTLSLIVSTTMIFIGSRKGTGRRCLELAHLRNDSGCFFHSHIPMDETSGTGIKLESRRWSKSFQCLFDWLWYFLSPSLSWTCTISTN